MSLAKKLHQWFGPLPEGVSIKRRIILWCCAALICVFFAALVLHAGNSTDYNCTSSYCQPEGYKPYTLVPGATLQQTFTAQGQSVGEWYHLAMSLYTDGSPEGDITVQIFSVEDNTLLGETSIPAAQLPDQSSRALPLDEIFADYLENPKQLPAIDYSILPLSNTFAVRSGRDYRLELTNESEADLAILGNPGVQSGTLKIRGQEEQGFVNLVVSRNALYRANGLTKLIVAMAVLTVLGGLALVLFTDVKCHVLYLVLAVGFGIVTLFDLTPIYGFDMAFQFDSVYVLSNEMMGIEGAVTAPSPANPEENTISYYRRACDDYSQYQFFNGSEVSANYVDTYAGLRNPFASPEEKDLILAATAQGFVGEQLYLYLPQAVGFTLARLLGLGMFPMLQIARILSYAVFVMMMYVSIRDIPFGKRIFLVLALTPTVLIQTVSITRDAMIIAMSFFLIAKSISTAYAEKKPKLADWLVTLVFSVLLAPCKLIYLPVSCFCLLTVYRHYFRNAGEKWKKSALWFGIGAAVLLLLVCIPLLPTIMNILTAGGVSLYGTQSYTIPMLLANPAKTLFVLANTLRNQIGFFLVNAVQLFDIGLGASDGLTLLIFLLLFLASFQSQEDTLIPGKLERGFMLLVATGVFLLTALASFRWTPVTSDVIEGLQGRYLTPVLPLLFLAFHNSKILRIQGNAGLFIDFCCCIFPAISLMNMYLWTISC